MKQFEMVSVFGSTGIKHAAVPEGASSEEPVTLEPPSCRSAEIPRIVSSQSSTPLPFVTMQTKSKFNWLLAALLLVPATSVRAADLIPLGSSWKFFLGTNEASSPMTAWRQVAYNDSAWAVGLGPIGYDTGGTPGTDPIATLLPDPRTVGNPVWTNTYFRKTFAVANPATITELLLTVYVDDGAVAWVNGVEVGRANVPDGELAHTSAATLAEETRTFTTTNIASLLVAGFATANVFRK